MNAVLERRVREHLTEPRPAPLEMTDTEIVEFISEYVISMYMLEGNKVFQPLYMLKCHEIGACSGTTLREAVTRAAARVAEINQ